MNNRIKELEKMAFDAVWDLDTDPIGPGTHFRPDGFEQKFAELIIKECIEINKQELAFNAFERLLNRYQEHFEGLDNT